MIRVGLNARLLHDPSLRGWNRYARNLAAALPGQGVELVLYTDRPLDPSHLAALPAGSYTVRQSPRLIYPVWEQRWLPRQCGRDGVAVLHSPFNFGLPWSSPCPRVLTLHDAIDQVQARRSGRKERWTPAALYHWAARTRADRIITVSEHAKGDLVSVLGVPPVRIRVIPEAADPGFLVPVSREDGARARGRHGLASPYVFYVGGWEERKNVPFLVRAFAAARLDGVDLVLAGGRDEQRAALAELARECGVAERVRLLGWVEEADLPALYSEALCFVYPSLYEGFGLQLVEAMALGAPTLASRATSLPEVLGTGGELFDPARPDALAALLRRVALEPEYRLDLSHRARRRSEDFSWSKTAERTRAVYDEVIRVPSHSSP